MRSTRPPTSVSLSPDPPVTDEASAGDGLPIDDSAFDPSILVEVVNTYLLGEQPSLTRHEVSGRSGVTVETAIERWRALGFPTIDDDRPAFTDEDVEALEVSERLVEVGVLSEDTVRSFARALGQSFARLADWQVRLLLASVEESDDDSLILERIDEVLPMVSRLQDYLWRRHLASTANRIALQTSPMEGQAQVAIGFIDIVGYTSRSRQVSARELASMVEHFEQVTADVVTEAGGQVVKTIGDEVLYSIDDPSAAVEIAVTLIERADEDDEYPQVRVGSAYGPVLVRLGDVFGPVVNLAARLTSVARPGRAVIDEALAERIRGQTLRYRVKRMRRASIKGFDAVEVFSLRRPTETERAKIESRTR